MRSTGLAAAAVNSKAWIIWKICANAAMCMLGSAHMDVRNRGIALHSMLLCLIDPAAQLPIWPLWGNMRSSVVPTLPCGCGL